MYKQLIALFLLFLTANVLAAEQDELADATADEKAETLVQEIAVSDAPQGPKTMSGMSILGNEEAPKALVIVPWKGSELGDDLSLNDSLDDRAKPVDREVFLRELSYYEIRSGR